MAVENLQVNASADDARSNSSGWAYSHTITTHYIGIKWWIDYWIGNRWTSVDIPQGATINSAILDMYNATIGEWTTVEMEIVGNDVDDAPAYSTSNKPSDNTDTTASFTTSIDVSTFQTAQWFGNITRDIKDVVQEIVNRAWWVSWNSMAIVLRDNWSSASNNISISTYDRATDRGMKLDVTYTTWWGWPTRRVFIT